MRKINKVVTLTTVTTYRIWRPCKFDYHKDNQMLKPDTANSIAHSLKFDDVEEMKIFVDDKL